jgi:hypothetical protein
MRPLSRLLAGSLLTCVAGCNTSIPTSPANSSPPVPQSVVISGTISEVVDGVSRPAAGRKVDFFLDGSACGSRQTPCEQAGVVETDQNGHYAAHVTVFPKSSCT